MSVGNVATANSPHDSGKRIPLDLEGEPLRLDVDAVIPLDVHAGTSPFTASCGIMGHGKRPSEHALAVSVSDPCSYVGSRVCYGDHEGWG